MCLGTMVCFAHLKLDIVLVDPKMYQGANILILAFAGIAKVGKDHFSLTIPNCSSMHHASWKRIEIESEKYRK